MGSLALMAVWLAAAAPAGRYDELQRQAAAAMARGDYERAAEAALQAAAAGRESRDARKEAQALNRAASARLFQGRYDPARGLFLQALALDRASGDRPGQVMRMNNLGSIAYYQADYQKALEWYRAAQRVLAGTSEPRLASATAVNLATLYQRLGLDERALAEYQAVEPALAALKPSERAQRLSNLGALYRRLGDPYKALECYDEAGKLFSQDGARDGELGALKNAGIARAFDLHQYPAALRIFDQAVELAARAGNRREAMQARLYRAETLRRLGRPAEEDLRAALQAARELKTPEEEWKALFALGRVEEAAQVIEKLREQTPGGSWRGQFLAGKRDVYDAVIERRLEAGDPEGFLAWSEKARARLFRDQLGKTLPHDSSLAVLQKRLAPDALLLVYWQGPRRGAVLWATRGRAGLAPRAPVAVRELLEALSTPDAGTWRTQAAAAGAHLLGGLPPLAAGASRQVIVVPDGLLQVVPFEALPVPGQGRLLIEQATVTYLPAASLLARARQQRGWWNPPWQRSLTALAAPQAVDPLGGTLPPLADAKAEAEAVAHAVPGRSAVFAAKTALLEAPAPLVHVAAHAAVSEEQPERSRILLERGALFLGEAAQLRMPQADLVTLSACETERGRLVEGEGVGSFGRAFLAAGARAVVTTLWRVADQPTASFMARFYHHLARGRTKAEALARAKREFLAAGGRLAHPYYWAGFVLNGEGWEPAPLPISWPPVLTTSGLFLLAALWWRRRATAPPR